jgi:sugar phosphate isomerase/epimerase
MLIPIPIGRFTETTVYVACSSLCFSRYPLAQALHSISELRFQKVDLAIHESGPHLKPSEVLADTNRVATILRKANISYAAFHADITETDPEKYKETLRAICRLGRLVACPLVNIAAAPLGSDMEAEIKRLQGFTRIAATEGVILTVETHRDTLVNQSRQASEICERVPGLGITLDPSHFMIGPDIDTEYEELYPYVRHVRLRDTAPAKWQVRVGQGQIEYGKIINNLTRENYERALSVDIHDASASDYPSDPEVRKLKYLLESMV